MMNANPTTRFQSPRAPIGRLTFFDADRFGGGVYTALDLTRDFGTVVSCSVALLSVTPGNYLGTRRARGGARGGRGAARRRGRRRGARRGRGRRGARRRGRGRGDVDGH